MAQGVFNKITLRRLDSPTSPLAMKNSTKFIIRDNFQCFQVVDFLFFLLCVCVCVCVCDKLQQKIEITDLKPFLTGENTSVLIILATTACTYV